MDTNSVSIEVIEKEATSMGNGIVNVIKDLQNLNSNVIMTSRGIQQLSDQFSSLGVSLEGSKLKDSFSKLNKDTLSYIDSSGNVVKVTKKLVDGNDTYETSIKRVNKEIQKSQSLWKIFTQGLTGALTKMKLGFIGVKSFYNSVLEFTDSATKYEEALNLFTVTMGTKAKEASEWVEKFSNALYLDDSDLMQYMGSFNSLVKGLGVGSDNAYKMSKNLTQLVYDLSSFKNIPIEESFRKIQSAMSGEIEPLRNVGVALSQNTLQELANSMGIEQRVATMSEAEKAQLRYIQIIKSTTEWQGDMARTLVSPANAIRVLKQQFTLLGRALGRVFIPFVMKTIPYVMALTEVLTDLANRLASFFGYKITDIDYSSLKDISLGIEDMGDAAEETTNKLNTMLAPFDKLNVVQNEKNNGTSPLANLFGDEYDLPEYDALAGLSEKMAKKVESAKKNLEEILGLVGLIGAGFLGWKIATSVTDFTNIWNDIAKKEVFTKKLGLTLALSGVALTAKGQLDIKENFLKGLAEKLGGTIATGVGTFMFTKNLGISLLVTGVSLATQSYFDTDNFWLSVLERFGAAAGLGLGMFTLTKNLAISFVVSLAYFVVTPEKNNATISKEIEDAKKEAENYNNTLMTQYNQITDNLEKSMSLIQHDETLYNQLLDITDENGHVKEGYEDRAKFILNELSNAYGVEYEYLDGQIQKFDDLKKSVEELIAKKKLELYLEAYRESYIIALQNQKTSYDKLAEADEKLKEKEQEQKNVLEELTEQREKAKNGSFQEGVKLEELKAKYALVSQEYNVAKETSDSYRKTIEKNTELINGYEDLMAANLSGKLDNIDERVDTFIKGSPEKIKESFKNIPEGLSNAISNLDISESDKKKLYTAFETTGKIIGSKFGESISDNIKIDTNTLKTSFNESLKKLEGSNPTAYSLLSKSLSFAGIKLKAYENGGFPKSGEFFIANEAGPELIGKIGNQTAVANNDQITTSITNALVTALSGMNLGGGQNKTIVNIGGRKVYEGVGTYVDSENDRYGTNYIQV